MKILLLIQDEPFYLKKYLPSFLEKNEVVGIALLSQKLPSDTLIKIISRYLKLLGPQDFIRMGVTVTCKRIFQPSLESHFRKIGIPLFKNADVNSKSFIENVRRLAPDLGISIASPQILKQDLINIAPKGFINLHGGYLPDYPGVFTPFWNLLTDSENAGCTVHEVSSKIDGGRILMRRQFKIGKDDTMMSLYDKITANGIEILQETIHQIESGTVRYIDNTFPKDKYHSFPTWEQGRLFRAKGCRIF